MVATSVRWRGTNVGSPSRPNSSQRCAPASSAFGGASVTRMVLRFVAEPRNAEQANLSGKLVQRISEGGTNRLILREIEHYRRDWMREARVRKSLTPWTS